MGISIQKARRAKADLAKDLEGARGLTGLGITKINGDYAVKVNFDAEPDQELPVEIGGVSIKVEIVGPVRKRNTGRKPGR